MTDAEKRARLALAELLSQMTANDAEDQAVSDGLGAFETLDDKLVLDACHLARHFMADRDLHLRDDVYGVDRLRELVNIIELLRG
jgi:hypothetical protein